MFTMSKKIFEYFRAKIEKSEHGNTLVYSLVEGNDTGEYSCTVTAYTNTHLKHSVKVRGKKIFKKHSKNIFLGIWIEQLCLTILVEPIDHKSL